MASGMIASQLKNHSAYIADETLAVDLQYVAAFSDDSMASAPTSTLDLDGQKVAVALEKAHLPN